MVVVVAEVVGAGADDKHPQSNVVGRIDRQNSAESPVQ